MVTLFRISSPLATVPPLILAQTRAKSDTYLLNPYLFRFPNGGHNRMQLNCMYLIYKQNKSLNMFMKTCITGQSGTCSLILSVLTVLGILIIKCMRSKFVVSFMQCSRNCLSSNL